MGTFEDGLQRYEAAGHAIQSGVKFEQEVLGSQDGAPKHLRTGLNLRACDHSALVRLLISKGVITDEEYVEAMAAEAEVEVRRYEERLSRATGKQVHLE